MAGFTLEEFKSNFQGGAKSYLFYIKPTIPATSINTERSTYLVMSGTLPGRSFEESVASWQGMDFKSAGKSMWDNWDITFRVDRNADIRDAFEEWTLRIHNPETNIRALPNEYMEDQIVQLLNENGSPITTYKLHDAWPQVVSAIDLDYAGTEVATFTVTFTYQYYTKSKGGILAGS